MPVSVNDYDHELCERIAELDLERGTPAYGISQQVIHMGYDTLSVKQKRAFDTCVVPLLHRLSQQHAINARTYNAPD